MPKSGLEGWGCCELGGAGLGRQQRGPQRCLGPVSGRNGRLRKLKMRAAAVTLHRPG